MIIHSPIFSGSINQAESAYANLSGSFTGSFKGIGDFEGLVADSVPYEDVTGKPTLVSGSSQVSYPGLSNIPSGIISSSAQIDALFNIDGLVSGASQITPLLPTGVVSGSSQVSYPSLSNIPAGIVSGSSQVTPLLPSGTVSGSSQINADSITNFDSNVKDKLNIDLVVSGSASDVKTFLSLQNVTNESKATMFSSPTFTGTVSGVTATHVGLGNVTNESKATMFASPTFTGTVSGVTATHVGLGNVTNESKATMFTSPTFTGTPEAPTAPANTNSTQIATTAYVQQELTDLIGGASAAFDTLIEISASLASGDSTLNTLVDGKLAKASNLSDLTDTSTARTNLGVAIGTNVQAFNSTLASVAGGTYSGDDSITTLGTISTGTWNGSVIASAYLDADTAHLTETQTFSGAKTFSAAVSITDSTASTTKTTGALKVTGGVGIEGALNVGGDVVAYASSDERLKDNIELISNPIEKVQSLKGVTWSWNENADELQKSLPNVGVIAQDVEKVLPQLVHDRENGFKGVDYAKLTGLLIEAIKEQQKQIDELKSKLG